MPINRLDEALKIPAKERGSLAEKILESINCEDEKIKQLWVAED